MDDPVIIGNRPGVASPRRASALARASLNSSSLTSLCEHGVSNAIGEHNVRSKISTTTNARSRVIVDRDSVGCCVGIAPSISALKD
jgi:hypothetical protein